MELKDLIKQDNMSRSDMLLAIQCVLDYLNKKKISNEIYDFINIMYCKLEAIHATIYKFRDASNKEENKNYNLLLNAIADEFEKAYKS
jgi:1-deoxy-D-xylulose 5-phosphate reductoisomerase